MKLGMEVGHIALDWDPAPPPKWAQEPPSFPLISIVAKRSPISATAEHFFKMILLLAYY